MNLLLILKTLAGNWKTILGVGLLVGSFLSGIQLSKTYYDKRIHQMEMAHAKQLIRFQDKVIEESTKYARQTNQLSKDLASVKAKLRDELKKPQYQCPIDDVVTGLLRDATKP